MATGTAELGKDAHDSVSVHRVHERTGGSARLLNPRAAALEACSLLDCGEAAAGHYERADSETAKCSDLGWSIPEAAILCEHGPSFAAAELEPLHVGHSFVTVAVDLVMGTKIPSRIA